MLLLGISVWDSWDVQIKLWMCEVQNLNEGSFSLWPLRLDLKSCQSVEEHDVNKQWQDFYFWMVSPLW